MSYGGCQTPSRRHTASLNAATASLDATFRRDSLEGKSLSTFPEPFKLYAAPKAATNRK